MYFIQERKFISPILVSFSLDGGETVGVLKLLARVVIVHVECDDATLSKDGWDARIEIPVGRTGWSITSRTRMMIDLDLGINVSRGRATMGNEPNLSQPNQGQRRDGRRGISTWNLRYHRTLPVPPPPPFRRPSRGLPRTRDAPCPTRRDPSVDPSVLQPTV